MTQIKFYVVKFINYTVYFLEKYSKRRKFKLFMNVYDNTGSRARKNRFILHFSFSCRIQDPRYGIRNDKKRRGSGIWV
jgi:hypothetical protein